MRFPSKAKLTAEIFQGQNESRSLVGRFPGSGVDGCLGMGVRAGAGHWPGHPGSRSEGEGPGNPPGPPKGSENGGHPAWPRSPADEVTEAQRSEAARPRSPGRGARSRPVLGLPSPCPPPLGRPAPMPAGRTANRALLSPAFPSSPPSPPEEASVPPRASPTTMTEERCPARG
ncbi:basic salivary proline-rich protein 3-like [Tachyglossus aculeatus]|uniref:basic salivary proline-rich protein 3-like n=1 Tax=Tachyglossus aculeatus TaxID=9261 RepID=UPI0018F34633|nr:basic salivary proline-rich protein 3-like [Tachyglossus aculeatus]